MNSSATLERDGEPWLVAADVCKALEIGNPSQAIARLEDNEKMNTLISNEGAASGTSSMAFVNEPASTPLYWVPASLKPRCSNVGLRVKYFPMWRHSYPPFVGGWIRILDER